MEIQTRCSEKGCPFPAEPGVRRCRTHSAMFEVDNSDEGLSDIEEVFIADQARSQNNGRRNGNNMANPEAVSDFFHGHLSIIGKPGLDEWLWKRERLATRLAVTVETNRRRYKNRKAVGLCVYCGRTNDRPGLDACTNCAERARDRRRRWKDAGLCFFCGKDCAIEGHISCSACYQKQKIRNELARIERAKHRVVRKRAPKTKGGTYLSAIAAARRRFKMRKNAGLCVHCGRPKNNPTLRCEDCRGKKNANASKRSREMVQSGICLRCGVAPAREGRVHCYRRGRKGVQRSAKILRARKRLRLCIDCGKPRNCRKPLRCEACAKKMAASKSQWLARKRVSAVKDGGTEAKQ